MAELELWRMKSHKKPHLIINTSNEIECDSLQGLYYKYIKTYLLLTQFY